MYEMYNEYYNQLCTKILYDDLGNIISFNNEICSFLILE